MIAIFDLDMRLLPPLQANKCETLVLLRFITYTYIHNYVDTYMYVQIYAI